MAIMLGTIGDDCFVFIAEIRHQHQAANIVQQAGSESVILVDVQMTGQHARADCGRD
ncbi:hypothetical protein D3C81_2081860 [compost metagenome]